MRVEKTAVKVIAVALVIMTVLLMLSSIALVAKADPAVYAVTFHLLNYFGDREVPSATVVLRNSTGAILQLSEANESYATLIGLREGSYILEVRWKKTSITIYNESMVVRDGYLFIGGRCYCFVDGTAQVDLYLNVRDVRLLFVDPLGNLVNDVSFTAYYENEEYAGLYKAPRGKYYFRNMPFGLFMLNCSRHYVWYDNFTVYVNKDVKNLYVVIPYYSLQFTIVDGNGFLMEGVNVTIYDAYDMEVVYTKYFNDEIARDDVKSLVPGAYYLYVYDGERVIAEQRINLRKSTSVTVEVSSGYTLSVKLLNVLNAPLSGLRVELYSGEELIAEATTDVTGEVSFQNLEGGLYTLKVYVGDELLFADTLEVRSNVSVEKKIEHVVLIVGSSVISVMHLYALAFIAVLSLTFCSGVTVYKKFRKG